MIANGLRVSYAINLKPCQTPDCNQVLSDVKKYASDVIQVRVLTSISGFPYEDD